MESMRTPFFIVALVLMVIIILVEAGSNQIQPIINRISSAGESVSLGDKISLALAYFPEDIRGEIEDALGENEDAMAQLEEFEGEVPGFAIPYLILIDGVLLFTVALIGIALIIPDNLQGKVQGIATLIFSILIILAGIGMIFAAIAAVIGMIVLLLAIPFGTLVYLAKFGSFPRGTASGILSLLFFLKLAFGAFMILAHQRFLQGKGLILIVLTSLLSIVIVSFLHGFVPGILVSITDVIAAIVVAILAIIWAVILLIGSVPAVLKAFT